MAALAEDAELSPNALTAKGLERLWALQFAEAQALFDRALQREEASARKYSGEGLDDPWGWGPAARALFRATPTVFAALISGHVKLLKPAAEAISDAIGEANKQRKASHSLINKALDHVPLLGTAVAAIFNPFKRLVKKVGEVTGANDVIVNRTEEQLLHEALIAEALGEMALGLCKMLSDEVVGGTFCMRRSYSQLLEVPHTSLTEYAAKARSFGLGSFALVLSYVPKHVAAMFNASALSFGESRENGIRMLREVLFIPDKKNAGATDSAPVVSVLASLMLLIHKLAESPPPVKRSSGAEKNSRQTSASSSEKVGPGKDEHLDTARKAVEDSLKVAPYNNFSWWLHSQLARRCGDIEGALETMRRVAVQASDGLRPFLRDFVAAKNSSGLTSVDLKVSVAYRPVLDLAVLLSLSRRWDEAYDVLIPLIDEDSSYVAQGMSLMLAAALVPYVLRVRAGTQSKQEGGNDGSGAASEGVSSSGTGCTAAKVAAAHEALPEPDIECYKLLHGRVIQISRQDKSKGGGGRMDTVLARKAMVNGMRHVRGLALYELLYFLGTLSFLEEGENSGIVECMETDILSHRREAKARVADAPASLPAREELMSSLLLLAVVKNLRRCESNDIPDLVQEVKNLAERPRAAGTFFTDPFHVPYALFELGTFFLRMEKPIEAKAALEQVADSELGFSFDKALVHRASSILDSIP